VGTHEVYASGAAPPMLVYAVLIAALGSLAGAALLCFRRAAARRRVADAAAASVGDSPPPLVEGTEVVLSGVVHHFEDHDVAVRVHVKQDGTEAESSGSWSHTWTEIDREIIVAPFILELANRERVLVRAPKNVDVADDLDQKVLINRTTRVLTAELVPGEKIFARGLVERSDIADPASAYRDVKWGWSLVPARGKMLLSSEPLGAGLRKRAVFHARAGWIALMLFVVLHVTLVGFYAQIGDAVETMQVTGTRTWVTTDSDGDRNTHYSATVVQPPTGAHETFEVGAGTYDELRFRKPDVFVRVDGIAWHLGTLPTIHFIHLIVIAGATLAYWLLYRSRRWWTRPWFKRQVIDNGVGKLDEFPPR
jgi:hypothetical protein